MSFVEGSSSSAPAHLAAEAFLSHSSAQRDFVHYLGGKLSDHGLRYFSSSETDTGSQPGLLFPQSLLQHVRTAKVVVLVLSEGFFNSKWCVRELAEALAVQQANPAKVLLPIFYGWNRPEDLGSWLQQQQQNFDDNLVKWSGHHSLELWNSISKFQGQAFPPGGSNVQLAESVLQLILHHIYEPKFDEQRIVSADYLVGWAVEWLSRQGGRLGIKGLGGLGKTTLAQLLYNRLYTRFNGSVAFIEVHQQASAAAAAIPAAAGDRLLQLQRSILQQLCRWTDNQLSNISSFGQGPQAMISALRGMNSRFLLILDDIWEAAVGQWLLPPEVVDMCSSDGSWVVVTSRDNGVVNSLLGAGAAQQSPVVSKCQYQAVYVEDSVRYTSVGMSNCVISPRCKCLPFGPFCEHDVQCQGVHYVLIECEVHSTSDTGPPFFPAAAQSSSGCSA